MAFTERIGLPLEEAILQEIRAEARKADRKVLDHMRYLLKVGLDADQHGARLDQRLSAIERRLTKLEATKK